MSEILIVDDEGNIRRSLRALLEAEGYRVRDAGTAEEGLADIEDREPDVVLLDLMLPGMTGLEALPRYLEQAPATTVVMMSGEASLSDAVEATRIGAFHFIEKPLTPESVLLTVKGALEVRRARDLTRALQGALGPDANLVGSSDAMEAVRERVRRVAPTDARILITGESGTGKELVATAIHALSNRSDAPFIRVNSAAIPRELVESEMFGHERGAFTGATERRRGRFELADGGTLFLDEIGDLDASAQAKLLRALESGVIERVGGGQPVDVDVRVIAATNRDLEREVEAGRFRDDLRFRLDVVPIPIPPLRERAEDIPALVEHASRLLRERDGITPPAFGAGAMDVLRGYDWPGNVRELFNCVERVAILHAGEEVGPDVIRSVVRHEARPGAGSGPGGAVDDDPRSLTERLDDHERELIRAALDASDGNVAEASRQLQTDRANLYRRMRRLGLRED
ncbi:MAG TPA: sigma-54 dependent transcriptional regulator [Longimicrobiales bacterium]|nr:sigma-54 dependent transcriptional regulator [Longimicrobiales bacterium]